MKKFIILTTAAVFIAGCSTQNDVAIQQAYASSRTKECEAVASIAQSGAASEAAVLMAARGCGSAASPTTGADRLISLAAVLAPVTSAAIGAAASLEAAKVSAEVQRDNITAGTERAAIDADVLTTLGRDQAVIVRPEVVQTPAPQVVEPVIVQTPASEVVQTPAPEIIQIPAPEVCSINADGVLVCN